VGVFVCFIVLTTVHNPDNASNPVRKICRIRQSCSIYLIYLYAVAEFTPYLGREDAFQQSVVTYLRSAYPKVLAIHCPNGGNRNYLEARKFKRLGVIAGVPDLLVFRHRVIDGVPYCGIALELKVGRNKPTANQQQIMGALQGQHWKVHVTWSLDEAIYLLEEFLD